MSNKLFIGSLSYNTSQTDLEQLFSEFGSVKSVKIVNDRETGRSRGFGFVEMGTANEAQAALSKINGKEIDGRNVAVSIATDKPIRTFNKSQNNRSW